MRFCAVSASGFSARTRRTSYGAVSSRRFHTFVSRHNWDTYHGTYTSTRRGFPCDTMDMRCDKSHRRRFHNEGSGEAPLRRTSGCLARALVAPARETSRGVRGRRDGAEFFRGDAVCSTTGTARETSPALRARCAPCENRILSWMLRRSRGGAARAVVRTATRVAAALWGADPSRPLELQQLLS
jgi:hypothetical protein